MTVLDDNRCSGPSTGSSRALAQIRRAALMRAAENLRMERQTLHEDHRRGVLSEEEYKIMLTRLTLRGMQIQNELKSLDASQ
ncbi:MAG: hypothetical protein QXS20_09660 [Candidatus Thorarchaeota archaeon]